jgi:catechol 2,3-dioxygenase-like lactoylglutathione lyase family enzyme
VSEPVGVSHVAVVTADLDGFRAFYEDTIGLETTSMSPTTAHSVLVRYWRCVSYGGPDVGRHRVGDLTPRPKTTWR